MRGCAVAIELEPSSQLTGQYRAATRDREGVNRAERGLQRYLKIPNIKVSPLLFAAAVLATTLHGHELHAEQFLHRITGYIPIHCR